MPIYSYICKKCGSNFDLLVGVTSQKTELRCQNCGSFEIDKTFSAFGIASPSKETTGPQCGSCNRMPDNPGSCPYSNG